MTRFRSKTNKRSVQKRIAVLLFALVACGGSGAITSGPSDRGGISSTVASNSPDGAPQNFAIGEPALPIEDGLVLWLRSDTGVTLAADGTVSSWDDLTGLGNRDATPIFKMPGPLYVPDAHAGFPALRSDGTPRSFFVNGGHGYPVRSASTVFLVMSLPSAQGTVPGGAPAGTEGLAFAIESSQGHQYSVIQTSQGGVEWANASTTALLDGGSPLATDAGTEDLFYFTTSLPSSGLHIFAETQLDGVSGSGYYDGCEVATFVPIGPSLYLMSLMGGPGDAFLAGNNDPLGVIISAGLFETTGDLMEVVQYDAQMSAEQIATVSNYLARRYGISACTPSTPMQ